MNRPHASSTLGRFVCKEQGKRKQETSRQNSHCTISGPSWNRAPGFKTITWANTAPEVDFLGFPFCCPHAREGKDAQCSTKRDFPKTKEVFGKKERDIKISPFQGKSNLIPWQIAIKVPPALLCTRQIVTEICQCKPSCSPRILWNYSSEIHIPWNTGNFSPEEKQMWDKTLWGRLRALKIISKENIFQKQGEFKSNVEAWLFKTATGNRQDNTAVTEIKEMLVWHRNDCTQLKQILKCWQNNFSNVRRIRPTAPRDQTYSSQKPRSPTCSEMWDQPFLIVVRIKGITMAERHCQKK